VVWWWFGGGLVVVVWWWWFGGGAKVRAYTLNKVRAREVVFCCKDSKNGKNDKSINFAKSK